MIAAPDASAGAPAPLQRHFIVPFSRIPSILPPSSPRLNIVKTRADVWTRCLCASLLCSRGTRNDTAFTGVFLGGAPRPPGAPPLPPHAPPIAPPPPPCHLLACGEHVRALRADQGTVAAILSAALPPEPLEEPVSAACEAAQNSIAGKRGCCQGFWLRRGGLREAVARACSVQLAGRAPVLLLLAQGAPPLAPQLSLLPAHGATALVVLLGDDEGWVGDQEAEAEGAARAAGVGLVLRASLGPMELLASQCITITHFLLDETFGGSSTEKTGPPPGYDPLGDAPKPCPRCLPT